MECTECSYPARLKKFHNKWQVGYLDISETIYIYIEYIEELHQGEEIIDETF